MDSEDSLSNHSQSQPSSHSSGPLSQNLSLYASSASSSSHGPHSSHSQHNHDRHQENTIGFDACSDYSDNPLNKGFVRNQDSFFSDFKSLYSNRSQKSSHLMMGSMDDSQMDNPYDSNSFSSFQSIVSMPEMKKQGLKVNRDRSRERMPTRRSSKKGNKEGEELELNSGMKKTQNNGFKKRK